MKNSYYIRIRKDYVSKKTGDSPIRLQVKIGRLVGLISLDISWPIQFFDDEAGICLPRFKDDPQVEPYNMLIRQAQAKTNDIFIEYRLRKIDITMENFQKEYQYKYSKTDFLEFYETKLLERLNSGQIEKITYMAQRSTLRVLKEFTNQVFFSNMKNFAKDFELFLKKRKNAPTTRAGRHKDIKTYLHLATEENIYFENPYKDFKVSKGAGNWKSCTQQEIQKLNKYYKDLPIGAIDRLVLRKFLFGCATGLRISDLSRVTQDWITGDYLVFIAYKKRKRMKLQSMPLSKRALELIDDCFNEGCSGRLFYQVSNDTFNWHLRKIQQKLEIKTKLHSHIARETFATLYLESDGKLEVLKEYLDHEQISTTMKYVHVSNKRKTQEAHKLDRMFEILPPSLN